MGTVSAATLSGATLTGNNLSVAGTISGTTGSIVGTLTTLSARVGGPADANQYAVVEVGRGATNVGASGTPALGFQFSGGGYRHFVRSRHNTARDTGNGIDFFLNISANSTDSISPGSGNILAWSVTPVGTGIFTSTPQTALDVSGTISATNLSVAGTISGTTGYYVGTVSAATLSGATITGNNLSIAGTISGGNGLIISGGATISGTGRLIVNSTNDNLFYNSTQFLAGGTGVGRILGFNSNLLLQSVSSVTIAPWFSATQLVTVVTEGTALQGNVGIGPTAPQTKLDVGGTISATNLSIAGTISTTTVRTTNLSVAGIISGQQLRSLLDGSASQPSIVVGGDISTGYYRPSANALAIATAGVKTANFSNNIIEFSNAGTQVLWLNNNQLQANGGSVTAPAYTYAVDASTGFFRAGAGQMAFAAGGVQYAVFSNSNVGIGVTAPAYALDVSSALTTATTNITSWGRFSSSNVAFTRGVTAIRGNAIQWPAFSNTMNTNLMTVVNDATVGTYIQILKSGIWTIDYQFNNTAGAAETYMTVSTVSTDTTYAAFANISRMIVYGRSESVVGGGRFTGYIASNSTYYYKFYVSVTTPSNPNFWTLRMCYLGETNASPVYPIVP